MTSLTDKLFEANGKPEADFTEITWEQLMWAVDQMLGVFNDPPKKPTEDDSLD